MLPTIPEDRAGVLEDHRYQEEARNYYTGNDLPASKRQVMSKRNLIGGSQRASLPESKRFISGGQAIIENNYGDQQIHLQEIKTGHRQMPTTKDLREMTESRRIALGYELTESRRQQLGSKAYLLEKPPRELVPQSR